MLNALSGSRLYYVLVKALLIALFCPRHISFGLERKGYDALFIGQGINIIADFDFSLAERLNIKAVKRGIADFLAVRGYDTFQNITAEVII